MSAVAAIRLPEHIDLSGFISLLQRLQVPHRVAEEAGEQVLWVPGEQLAEQVRELYGRYPQGNAEVLLEPSQASTNSAPGFVQQLKNSPLTAIMLALTFVVFAVTGTGENYTTVRWFSCRFSHSGWPHLPRLPE